MAERPGAPLPTIRRAGAADVAAIVALLADDDLGQQREPVADPLPSSYRRAFADIDRDPAHLLVVAEREGTVVATLHLTFLRYLTYGGGLRAQIEAVRVAREARGTGLGRELVAWAIDRARERGAHLVQLTTDTRRPDAQRFYASLGFATTHVGMKLHLADGGAHDVD